MLAMSRLVRVVSAGDSMPSELVAVRVNKPTEPSPPLMVPPAKSNASAPIDMPELKPPMPLLIAERFVKLAALIDRPPPGGVIGAFTTTAFPASIAKVAGPLGENALPVAIKIGELTSTSWDAFSLSEALFATVFSMGAWIRISPDWLPGEPALPVSRTTLAPALSWPTISAASTWDSFPVGVKSGAPLLDDELAATTKLYGSISHVPPAPTWGALDSCRWAPEVSTKPPCPSRVESARMVAPASITVTFAPRPM